MLVCAHNTVNVCLGKLQVYREFPSSKPVLFRRESDCASRVWQLFAVILKGVQVLSVINEEAWNAASSGKKPPSAEVDHEAAGGEQADEEYCGGASHGK